MKTSEATDQIALALSLAQAEIKPPVKDREVEVKTDKGYTYKYKYAQLDGVLEAIVPALSKNGLSFTQAPTRIDGKMVLVTRLAHKSGQWYECEWELASGGGPQARGSDLTYGRRYSLEALIGVAATADDDAGGAEQEKPQPKPAPKAEKPPAPAKPATPAAPKAPTTPEAKRASRIERIERLVDMAVSLELDNVPAKEAVRALADDQLEPVYRSLKLRCEAASKEKAVGNAA